MRLIAALLASEQMPTCRASFQDIKQAALSIHDAVNGADSAADFESRALALHESAGYGIFWVGTLGQQATMEASRALLRPRNEPSIDPLFFQTMPLWWLGCAYQSMLALRPGRSPGELRPDRSHRKNAGVFFTPPALVDYISRSVVMPLAQHGTQSLRILDPSMGGGDFLARAVHLLADADDELRSQIAANCLYGIDIDPLAVEIARFCVWAASGFADGISEQISSHLICGDALEGGLFSPLTDIRGTGFDAVIGNPPYIASKNGLDGGASLRTGGQSDSYLLFLQMAIERELVKPGGALAMVLPDPMLVRANAAQIRCKLASEWTIESILHIYRAFPGATVANIVPVLRNSEPTRDSVPVTRIERVGDRRAFVLQPIETASKLAHHMSRQTALAQERCEFLYLLEREPGADIIRRIHGPEMRLTNYQPPFMPLKDLNISAIYRGEEIGKSAITSDSGDMPMLLGGQSVQPYEITWEGRKIDRARIRKPIDRYERTKILVQKSSPRVIAALDESRGWHKGYVFPQSVYAIELAPDGIHPLYLLCLLNSRVINDYIWRTVTAYKMVQPQLEIEDIRALPIRSIEFTTPAVRRKAGATWGIQVFDDECRFGVRGFSPAFSDLADFVVKCLVSEPERSDIVHDVLVHLGRLAVDLTRKSRRHPDTAVTHDLDCALSAIETVVRLLYCEGVNRVQ